MARNTVIVSVLGDTRDLQNKLGSSESALGKFGKAAAVMGLAVGAAVALVGAQAFGAVAEIERETFTAPTARKYLSQLLAIATGEELTSYTLETWTARERLK